jgi:hypothetical protein
MINLLGQLHQVFIVKEKARKNCGPKKIKHVMDRLKGGNTLTRSGLLITLILSSSPLKLSRKPMTAKTLSLGLTLQTILTTDKYYLCLAGSKADFCLTGGRGIEGAQIRGT